MQNTHFYAAEEAVGACERAVENHFVKEEICCNVPVGPTSDGQALFRAFSPKLSASYYSTEVMDFDYCLYTQVASSITQGARFFPIEIVAYFPPPPPLAATVPVYAMYADWKQDFILTTNVNLFLELDYTNWATVFPGRSLVPQTIPYGDLGPAYLYIFPNKTDPNMIPVYQLLVLEHHLYTTNEAERSTLLKFGAVDEGVIGYVYPPPTGPAPLYASMSPAGSFFYTMDLAEHYNAISGLEHKGQGIACYCFPPNEPKPQNTVELWRMYDQETDDHFYTADLQERNSFEAIYKLEGIAGYVYPSDLPFERFRISLPLLRFLGEATTAMATPAGIGIVPGTCP